MSLNEFTIGGDLGNTKKNKNLKKEKAMDTILSYESDKKDLSVEIYRIRLDESLVYGCKISSNSDCIELYSENDELYEIVGMMFKQLETFGKVVKIDLDNVIYLENEIKKVNFVEEGEVEVYLINGDAIYTNIIDCEIETSCFATDEYNKCLLQLRLQINRLYQKHAA